MDVLAHLLVVGALINAAAIAGFPLNGTVNSVLRAAVMRRNGLDMHETSPLCPNCVHPMRLTRRIAADETHHGQDVFECAGCRVAMTQAARTERQIAGR